MTYEAEVQFKFDATYTHDYNRGFASHLGDEDFLPEEHFLITAPAADLNCKQYFKLFEKFMLCVGMCPSSIRSGAMSLVFNDMVKEEEQRKVCDEYELTMDEDLRKKYEEFKEEAYARLTKTPAPAPAAPAQPSPVAVPSEPAEAIAPDSIVEEN